MFDEDRYFDVFVEYAKAAPEDMLIQITVHNRGPEPATLQLLPTLWFRNDWAWGDDVARPILRQLAQDETGGIVALAHRDLGERFFYAQARRSCSSRKTKPIGSGFWARPIPPLT